MKSNSSSKKQIKVKSKGLQSKFRFSYVQLAAVAIVVGGIGTYLLLSSHAQVAPPGGCYTFQNMHVAERQIWNPVSNENTRAWINIERQINVCQHNQPTGVWEAESDVYQAPDSQPGTMTVKVYIFDNHSYTTKNFDIPMTQITSGQWTRGMTVLSNGRCAMAVGDLTWTPGQESTGTFQTPEACN